MYFICSYSSVPWLFAKRGKEASFLPEVAGIPSSWMQWAMRQIGRSPTSTGPRHVIMRDKKARSSENPAGYPFFDSGNIGGKLCYSQLIFPGGLVSGARKCHRTTNDSEGDTKSLNQHPLQMFASATASIHPKNTQIGHYGEKLFLGGCFWWLL